MCPTNCSVIPIFKSAAEELINASGLSPVELLAKALAWTAVSYSGYYFSVFKSCYDYILEFFWG